MLHQSRNSATIYNYVHNFLYKTQILKYQNLIPLPKRLKKKQENSRHEHLKFWSSIKWNANRLPFLANSERTCIARLEEARSDSDEEKDDSRISTCVRTSRSRSWWPSSEDIEGETLRSSWRSSSNFLFKLLLAELEERSVSFWFSMGERKWGRGEKVWYRVISVCNVCGGTLGINKMKYLWEWLVLGFCTRNRTLSRGNARLLQTKTKNCKFSEFKLIFGLPPLLMGRMIFFIRPKISSFSLCLLLLFYFWHSVGLVLWTFWLIHIEVGHIIFFPIRWNT